MSIPRQSERSGRLGKGNERKDAREQSVCRPSKIHFVGGCQPFGRKGGGWRGGAEHRASKLFKKASLIVTLGKKEASRSDAGDLALVLRTLCLRRLTRQGNGNREKLPEGPGNFAKLRAGKDGLGKWGRNTGSGQNKKAGGFPTLYGLREWNIRARKKSRIRSHGI